MSKKAENTAKDNAKNQRIQVFVRTRPLNTPEEKYSRNILEICNTDKKEIRVRDGKMINKAFAFDRVFGQDTDQISVYQAVVGPLIKEVLMGYNCTVFAYGQTGTGKTYTMEGERSDKAFSWDEDPQAGIIPRSLHQLFDELYKEENVEFSVHVSFLELYNEELFDLLSPNEVQVSKLRLFEDSSRKGSVVIQGLEEIKVNSKDEVYSILEKGTMRRQKACTNLNAMSSRSHTVFSVTVHIKENTIEGEELLKTGKLNLVDLAGSENIGRSGATQKTAREAGNINQSLLTLGRVITSLVEKAPHVPYRESKLTRLLQDSLGGHTKTSIIATVSPALCNLEETVSTLEYAQRAKSITIKPEVNQKMTKKALIKEYTEEIEKLRKDLAAARDKSGFFIHTENYNAMQQDMIMKENYIEELKLKIEALTAEKEKIERLFSETKRKYKRTRQELTKTSKVLDNTQKKLSKTALELDEKRYIINIQTKTEEQLSRQAQTLLQVTDKSTHDVEALHNKIARKKNVEKTNEELSQEFRASFQNKLAICHDTASQMYEEQAGNLNEIRSINGDILGLCKHLLDVSAFQDFHMQLVTLIDQNEQHVVANAVDGVDFCTNCAEKVSVLKNQNKQQQNNLKSFKEKYVLKSSTSLSSMQDLLQLLRQMQEKTVAMGKQFEACTKSLMTTLELQLHDMSDIFDSCFEMLTEHIVTNSEKVSLIQSEYEQSEQKLNEIINNRLSEILAEVKNHQQETRTVMSTRISDLNCNSNQIVEASHVKNQQKKKIVDNYTIEKTEKKKDCDVLSQDFIYQENQNKQAENICLSSISNQEEEKKDIETYFQSSELLTNADEQNILKIDEMLNNRTNDVLKKKEQYQEHIKKNKDNIEKRATEYKILIKKRASSLVPHIDHQSEVISKVENGLHEYSETIKKELLKRDLELQQFFEEGLQKDISTGATPERQEYRFPRKFAATSPHDTILNRFRAQLATNEAIAVDLPLDSSLDNSFDDISPSQVDPKFGTNYLSVPRICYSSDEANVFDSDESVSSQPDAITKNKKNRENQRSARKASKLPRRKNLPVKGFAKPQAPTSQRKPLTLVNEVVQE